MKFRDMYVLRIVAVFIILILTNSVFAQKNVDSLKNLLPEISGPEKIDVLQELALELWQILPEQRLAYAEQALALAEESGDNERKIHILRAIAIVYENENDFTTALHYYEQAYTIAEEIDHKGLLVRTGIDAGFSYGDLGEYDRAMEYLRNALAITENTEFNELAHLVLTDIGSLYEYMGNFEEAIVYHRKALQKAEAQGDIRETGYINRQIGIVYAGVNSYNKAMEYYLTALRIAEKAEDWPLTAGLSNDIGILYSDIGNFDKALEYLRKSIEIADLIGDKLEIAAATENIGNAYSDNERFDMAVHFFLDASTLYEELNLTEDMANALSMAAEMYLLSNEYDKTLETALQARAIAEEIDLNIMESNNLITIGDMYVDSGKRDEALRYYQDALQTVKDTGEHEYIMYAYQALGNIYVDQKNYDTGIEHLQKALESAEKSSIKEDIVQCYDIIYNAYNDMGDYRNAAAYLSLFVALNDSMLSERSDASIATLQAVYDLEKKETEIALLERDYAVQELELNRNILVRNSAIGGLFIVIIFFAMIYFRYNEKKKTEETLRESEQKFKDLANLLPDVIFEIDMNGELTFVNQESYKTFGYTQEEFEKGLNVLQMYIPEDHDRLRQYRKEVLYGTNSGSIEGTALKKDGSTFPLIVHSNPIFKNNKIMGLRGIAIDITEEKLAEKERKNLEEQFFQAQKLESIGRLAGGVAHDFNNILTSILGHAELLKMKFDDTSSRENRAADIIFKGVKKATDLTKRLLGFAREGKYNPIPLNINQVINDTLKVSEKIFEKNINVKYNFEENINNIEADKNQIDQVLTNLIINAKDAMPKGGELIFKTENIYADKEYVKQHLDFNPGDYVRISIRDTGTGMTKVVKNKIFDPFFTTKVMKKESGLDWQPFTV